MATTLVPRTVDAIADALARADLPDRFDARGYRLTAGEAVGPLIQVAIVLDGDNWDAETITACESARHAAAEALLPFEMAVRFSFRTKPEHERFG